MKFHVSNEIFYRFKLGFIAIRRIDHSVYACQFVEKNNNFITVVSRSANSLDRRGIRSLFFTRRGGRGRE